MLDHIEPAESRLMISLIKRTWPIIAFFKNRRLRIEVSKEVFEAIRMLKDQPTIICPNHPAQEDGLVLFALSGILKEQFSYLTAREVFGVAGSLQAKWLQKLGCYSVQRGTADIHAFRASCQLLQGGQRKLVIFPEGEISYQNGLLRDFESGPELIALSTLHSLKQPDSRKTVWILPLALRYRYSRGMEHHLEMVMSRVEKRMKLAVGTGPFPERIRQAYLAMLSMRERQYSLHSRSTKKIEERMGGLILRRIAELEALLGMSAQSTLPVIRRIHLVMNGLAEMVCSKGNDKALPFAAAKKHYNDLRRLLGFTAVTERSFNHDLSQEAAAELLRLLVEEVGAGISPKKPDIVQVGAAPAIDVAEYIPVSKAERRNTVQRLKTELRNRIFSRLRVLQQTHNPVFFKAEINLAPSTDPNPVVASHPGPAL